MNMKNLIKYSLIVVITFLLWNISAYIYKDAKRENKYFREMENLQKEKLKYEIMILKGECNCK